MGVAPYTVMAGAGGSPVPIPRAHELTRESDEGGAVTVVAPQVRPLFPRPGRFVTCFWLYGPSGTIAAAYLVQLWAP